MIVLLERNRRRIRTLDYSSEAIYTLGFIWKTHQKFITIKLLGLLIPSGLWMICNVSGLFTYICVYFCMSVSSFLFRSLHGQCQSFALAQIHLHPLIRQPAQVTIQKNHIYALPHHGYDKTLASISILYNLSVLPQQMIKENPRNSCKDSMYVTSSLSMEYRYGQAWVIVS